MKSETPDGEILFLAADPNCKIKGIGTALLCALEEREKGKTLYLYTDDACTYQFYEHRGFERMEEKGDYIRNAQRASPIKVFCLQEETIARPVIICGRNILRKARFILALKWR